MKISKFKKVGICFLVIAMVLSCFAACGGTDEPADEGGGDGAGVTALSDVTIGACVMSLQHEYMINLVKGYEEFQKQTGLDLIVTDGGNMEPEKQVTNVENFIEQGVDGIIVQCISIDTMKDTLNRAYEKGMKVAYYPKMDGIDIKADAYLAYDEYGWGKQLGEEAVKWIHDKLGGKAKILSLETSLEQNSILRAQGWKDVVGEAFPGGEVELITVEAKASETAMNAIESALQANPDANMVLSYNDEMGIGAYQAVVQSTVDQENFFVGSCDGTQTVLDMIAEEDSVYRCTIGNVQSVPEVGFYWLQNIVMATLGLDYEEAFPVPTMAITADNLAEYESREAVFELDPALSEYMESL